MTEVKPKNSQKGTLGGTIGDPIDDDSPIVPNPITPEPDGDDFNPTGDGGDENSDNEVPEDPSDKDPDDIPDEVKDSNLKVTVTETVNLSEGTPFSMPPVFPKYAENFNSTSNDWEVNANNNLYRVDVPANDSSSELIVQGFDKVFPEGTEIAGIEISYEITYLNSVKNLEFDVDTINCRPKGPPDENHLVFTNRNDFNVGEFWIKTASLDAITDSVNSEDVKFELRGLVDL